MVTWSPKTNLLVSSSAASVNGQTGLVFLWDVDNAYQQKKIVPSYKARQVFDDTAFGLLTAWSPDGQHIAIANAGNYGFSKTSLFIYKSDLTSPETSYLNGPALVDALVIDTLAWLDGQYIIGTNTSISINNGFQLNVWDWTQPQRKYTPVTVAGFLSQINDKFGQGAYSMLAVSPQGKTIAFAMSNGVLIGQVSVSGNSVVWNPRSPVMHVGSSSYAEADGVAWSPDGQRVATCTNVDANTQRSVSLLDTMKNSASPTSLANPHSTTDLTVLTWSSATSNPLVAVGTQGGTIFIWNTNQIATVAKTLQGPVAEVTGMAFSADGQWLAASFADTQSSILVWKM
jgi:WD40 repeat protein